MSLPLRNLWLVASRDLGIRVTVPFILQTNGDNAFEFDALVHDFGAENGMVVLEKWNYAAAMAAVAHRFGVSCMSGGTYERDGIIEVLSDWGWAGTAQLQPEWLRAPRVSDEDQ